MERLKEKVETFKQTNEELKKWQEVKRKVFEPQITDVSLIPLVFELVNELYEKDPNIKTFKYDPKHYFLICIIFLYSPRVMIEENMNEGIRDIISDVLKISSAHVSNSCAIVRDWFFIYKDFEQSLAYLYSELLNRLKEYD